jgi:hypothetical protein
MYNKSLQEWLLLHYDEVQRYLDDKVHLSDHSLLWTNFLKEPTVAKVMTEDYSIDNQTKLEYILKTLAEKSVIALVCGIRGSGKTALMLYLAEEIHKRYPYKKLCILQSNLDLPDWIEQTEDIFDVPEGSIVLFDEASLSIAARNAMSRYSKDVSGLLAISRHQGLTIIFCSQHSGLVDVNVLRMADVFIFKILSWEEVSSPAEHEKISPLLSYLKYMMPTSNEESLFTDGEKWYLVRTPLPSFWSDNISKTYRKLTYSEAVAFVKNSLKRKMPAKNILNQLKIRGMSMTENEIKEIAKKL